VRPRHSWDDNIKIDLNKMEFEDVQLGVDGGIVLKLILIKCENVAVGVDGRIIKMEQINSEDVNWI
jgi:hypothetical protein